MTASEASAPELADYFCWRCELRFKGEKDPEKYKAEDWVGPPQEDRLRALASDSRGNVRWLRRELAMKQQPNEGTCLGLVIYSSCQTSE
ncbi:putative tRNA pseudouridine synthase Pus10 [Perkinsus olseni]|uniref:Putative tRNA pseudouridine synthase Pus10 n=1 Tax=Perkinsus olseni TaxID=32597 RepID=A0A7J6P8W3_PEROL|nr:putative tRNA pseudouridine synthase Pus10 [Perkinsus olseni]